MLASLFSGFIPAVAVFFIDIVVLFIINICYKFLVKQDEVKKIKDKMKELNSEFKKLQKQGKTEDAGKLMKDIMAQQNKLMPMTMKPMLVSMIIVILILPGLHTIYGNVDAGMNDRNIFINGQAYNVSMTKESIILNGKAYAFGSHHIYINNRMWNIHKKEASSGFLGLGSKPAHIEFEQVVALSPVTLPFFGDDFGWLGWYFICSIPIMVIIKKLLGVKI